MQISKRVDRCERSPPHYYNMKLAYHYSVPLEQLDAECRIIEYQKLLLVRWLKFLETVRTVLLPCRRQVTKHKSRSPPQSCGAILVNPDHKIWQPLLTQTEQHDFAQQSIEIHARGETALLP